MGRFPKRARTWPTAASPSPRCCRMGARISPWHSDHTMVDDDRPISRAAVIWTACLLWTAAPTVFLVFASLSSNLTRSLFLYVPSGHDHHARTYRPPSSPGIPVRTPPRCGPAPHPAVTPVAFALGGRTYQYCCTVPGRPGLGGHRGLSGFEERKLGGWCWVVLSICGFITGTPPCGQKSRLVSGVPRVRFKEIYFDIEITLWN